MITRYKIPCEHCGKINEVENDINIHELDEELEKVNKRIATLWEVLRKEDKSLKAMLKEIKVHNKLLEGYDLFLVDCDNCNFKRRGSLGEVLKITYCPNCKAKLELKALILPPDDDELLKQHPPTFQGDLR